MRKKITTMNQAKNIEQKRPNIERQRGTITGLFFVL